MWTKLATFTWAVTGFWAASLNSDLVQSYHFFIGKKQSAEMLPLPR